MARPQWPNLLSCSNINYHRGKKIAKLIIFELKLAISKVNYLRKNEN